ncbi:probable G-protein coupled receptor 132 [Hemiscyllium ocellatum]|uniref:probable G-protein coupled receptor 132 n=1 Tax=Hemiscyllium ocellatum TaxID=170820 RepID=UPI0029668F01|nr:probable G-protein coupled receptor 132 [Hemiscyllium ocellatum]XP_060685472.1 probable G-protein coupled receptor 132 [Hemiscyllium ocellatum]XP_060685473.1 probable G-protein coupled receptor 132 [Hemiscyllium ocellatum]XP_060685474.1 probable G-protein coupled receptor 132 [Hemiscyllium ocellatum]XP_060685476.1 probable G-protein coupled receptor 132 [Hemiscyllium ocellatum]
MMNSSQGEMLTCNISYDQGTVPLVTVYSLVLIVGAPANFVTLCLSFVKICRKNVLSVYLFTLSLSDLLYMGTIPQWILYVKNHNKWTQSDTACQLTGFIFFNNLYISILLLCCISTDRCLVVLYPIEAQWRRRRRTAVMVCMGVWLLVMMVHLPVFFLSNVKSAKEKNDSCFETIPMPPLVAKFNYARFSVGFCIPLFILALTNLLIFRRIQASPCLNIREKTKVKYLAIAIILIFLGCFAPYHLVLLSRAIAFSLYKDSCWFEEKIYNASTLFLCLCTINSAINPILYMFSCESVRQEFCREVQSIRNRSSRRSNRTDSYILRNGQTSGTSVYRMEHITSEN